MTKTFVKFVLGFSMSFYFGGLIAQESAESLVNNALIQQEQLVSNIIQKIAQSNEPTERNTYNDSLMSELQFFMDMEGAMYYDYQKLEGISILSVKSQHVVIMTWELANELDELRYYGLIT